MTISNNVLDMLLQNKATGKHIVWATNNYQQYGEGYTAEDEIIPDQITGTNAGIIQPRVQKVINE